MFFWSLKMFFFDPSPFSSPINQERSQAGGAGAGEVRNHRRRWRSVISRIFKILFMNMFRICSNEYVIFRKCRSVYYTWICSKKNVRILLKHVQINTEIYRDSSSFISHWDSLDPNATCRTLCLDSPCRDDTKVNWSMGLSFSNWGFSQS